MATDERQSGASARRPGGHVFVVHGRVESLVHDAVIIPTADNFHVRRYWHKALSRQPRELKPEGWPRGGVGQASDGSSAWFVSVGAANKIDPQAVVDRAMTAVRAAADGLGPGTNRTKPLIALPVLGIGGGGHGASRGDLSQRLLTSATAAAAELDVDLALVTPDPSVHAAVQHLRRDRVGWPLSQARLAEAQRLAAAARSGQLALFLGAGVSIPAGLPTWAELLAELVSGSPELRDTDLTRLSALDQAQLVEELVPDLQQRVRDIVRKHERPALAHALLAALRCREVVTTNYDRLYETAVRATRRDAATVLPWDTAVGAAEWILKMHGDVENPRSIVLTRRHFVRFDAQTRPSGALLQTLLLTRHLLLVGASLNDDNVVRLMHEVQAYRDDNKLSGVLGTLLDVDTDVVRQRLWQKQLSWVSFEGGDIAHRARELEIFLDAIACFAADDKSWLLDPRFEALLSMGDRQLASDVRKLHRRIRAERSALGPLADVLDDFGPEGGKV